ncbi:helix-turn-helix transcriptional regulator [Sphingomonas sp. LaA6.9]|uniref:helix-turn-helix transcriptional regulator n=1 Tax=Sphingomonas sp. LaA6.9 TaxID=2919914 RepID=UPI001F50327A|nr:AraC family transcriptional regulator [Sphingomonas sp. LaA6.9]MCJ8159447.1 AraC family transcriptional regulator [Sphingomonas sp. LaA6.9]
MPVNAPSSPSVPVASAIASGAGWTIEHVICTAGPDDRTFEERHGWTSVAAVLNGQFSYRSEQGGALMAPGALLLGNSGTCFECGHTHSAGDRCLAFRFAPELVEEVVRGMADVRATHFARAGIPPVDALVPLFQSLPSLIEAHDPLCAEQAALAILSNAIALDRDTHEPPPDARDLTAAAEAAQIIRADFVHPITIAALATATGTTRRRLSRAFRRAIGVTPWQYVLNRRLDAAAALLRDSDDTVLNVALDTGFGDLSEFTRRFRARFGLPPSAWRKHVRSDQSAKGNIVQ